MAVLIGNCKECDFWRQQELRGKCWMECEAARGVDRDEKIGAVEIAVWATASDDTGLNYGVITGPDFGCVRFKSKKLRNNKVV